MVVKIWKFNGSATLLGLTRGGLIPNWCGYSDWTNILAYTDTDICTDTNTNILAHAKGLLVWLIP